MRETGILHLGAPLTGPTGGGGKGLRQYTSELFSLVRDADSRLLRRYRRGVPYQLDNVFLGYVTAGRIDVTVNMVRRTVPEGTFYLVASGSVFQVDGWSADYRAHSLHIQPDYAAALFSRDTRPLPDMTGVFLTPAPGCLDTLEGLLESLWRLTHDPVQDRRSIDHAMAALLCYVRRLIIHAAGTDRPGGPRRSREAEIFRAFTTEVNRHCQERRDLDFYASALHLNKQYLSTVVRSASGQTARHWIELAVITRLKFMLRHGTLTVSELTDRLAFPSPAHLCRYFKRATGMTPLQYRNAR